MPPPLDHEGRPKADSLAPLRTLGPFIRPYRKRVAAALAALVIASGALLAVPIALRYLIDNGFADGNLATVNRYFGWFFAAAMVFGCLPRYAFTWSAGSVSGWLLICGTRFSPALCAWIRRFLR